MSIHNEIHSAINDAFEAHAKVPNLEKQIADLQETVALLRMELEDQSKIIHSQAFDISERDMKIAELTRSLAAAEVLSEERNSALDRQADQLYHQTLRVKDLEVDVAARSTMIELLEADKVSLQLRLTQFEGLETKLREALAATFPAAREVAATTFPNPVDSGEGNGSAEPVGAEPVVGAIPVAGEVTHDEPAAGCFPYRYW